MLVLAVPLWLAFSPVGGALWADEVHGVTTASPDEPVYKVLFESGFYHQVLEYLDARIEEAPDSLWQEYQKYRAFSLILTGRSDSARHVFETVLNRDSTFTLDPVRTSPKIYETFHKARVAWESRVEKSPDSSAAASDTASVRDVGDTVQPQPILPDTTSRLSIATDTLPQPSIDSKVRLPWYSIPVRILPGGAGQFLNRQPVKGALLLAIQAAGLGASIATYRRRNDLYDPRFGWYEGNAREYERHTTAYRVEFGVFAFAYLYGVVDAIVVHVRGARDHENQEHGVASGRVP